MKIWIFIFALLFNWNTGSTPLSGGKPTYNIGEPIDQLNGVVVYYNGSVKNVLGRNVIDVYNVGLKWQCVEFVKRYYYQYYGHRMPDTYGHAREFFDFQLSDFSKNERRDLYQFSNPSRYSPEAGDLLVMNGNAANPYGHVAIVSKVWPDQVELIHQNPGPSADSRLILEMDISPSGSYYIDHPSVLGWLRK